MFRIAFLLFALLLPATGAGAWGLGPYVEYHFATGYTDQFPGDLDHEMHGFGLGFVLDSTVAKDRLLNYRLNVGYKYARGRADFTGNNDFESHWIAFKNTLGFGLVRTKSLRLWLGGGVELGVGGRTSDFRTQDAFEVKFALGPELGVNYHVQPRISIGVTAWYQYSFGGALQDSEDPDPDCAICTLFGSEDNYNIREHIVGLRVSVLFRNRKDVFR